MNRVLKHQKFADESLYSTSHRTLQRLYLPKTGNKLKTLTSKITRSLALHISTFLAILFILKVYLRKQEQLYLPWIVDVFFEPEDF